MIKEYVVARKKQKRAFAIKTRILFKCALNKVKMAFQKKKKIKKKVEMIGFLSSKVKFVMKMKLTLMYGKGGLASRQIKAIKFNLNFHG